MDCRERQQREQDDSASPHADEIVDRIASARQRALRMAQN
jgi:hypothetical protein